jgi:hypothetical protein
MVCLAKSLVLVGNFGALASVSASRTSHPHINIKSTFDDRRCLDAITQLLLSDNTDVTLESVFTPLLWPILLAILWFCMIRQLSRRQVQPQMS